MTTIRIDWIHGRPHRGAEDDEARASEAAGAVLASAGVEPTDGEAEYNRQWAEYDDEAPMTGLARLWVEARDAANRALTAPWHNPGGASCSIRA